MQIKFKKIHPMAKAPHKAHPDDACWDLFTVDEVVINPHETVVLGTGIIFDIPPGYCLKDYSRSGLAAKSDISILNGPGVIDSGYTGEVSMIVHNHGLQPFRVHVGMKLSQIMLERLLDYTFVEDNFSLNTIRGANGLGSTGI